MPRMLWLLLLLPALVACAPAHTLATPAEEAALDRALLADFWDRQLPHSACVHDLLGREGQTFYLNTMCAHWERKGTAGEWRTASGSIGPAVVTLGQPPTVHQLLTPEFIPQFFPPALQWKARLADTPWVHQELTRRNRARALP